MIRRRRNDSGFTLVELLIAIVIMGVITVPIANLVMGYFDNYRQTEATLAESHDMQITDAYFSQDVSNLGMRATSAPYASRQSVWTAPSGTYCGSGLGTALLLLRWDDWTATSSSGTNTGQDTIHSVDYVVESGTLHRIYCSSGSTTTSDATLVQDLVYPDGANVTPVTCSSSCTGATPPAKISLKLSIEASGDTSISYLTLTGQRRQS